MDSKARWGLVFWLAALTCAGVAAAQQAQWLQYRTSADAYDTPGGYQLPAFSAKAPAGLKLPKFASDRPLFFRWRAPAAPGGGLWLALDRSGEGRPYDTLYADTNADGSLADQAPILSLIHI